MTRGSTLLWLVLYGACFFVTGFLFHRFIDQDMNRHPASYLERLQGLLDLSVEQREGIRRMLEEEDRRILELREGEAAREIYRRIAETRKETAEAIRGILDVDQQKTFERLISPAERTTPGK